MHSLLPVAPESFVAGDAPCIAPAGTFDCSDRLINQLQHNIQWGQKGNFVDVPTDCPQRDERLGWTGDAQAFARTACFNAHAAYSLALAFDLLPENLRAQAAGRLAADVRKFKHITTGFLGAPLICRVLSNHGYLEEAFMLLTRKEYPSWLYPITQGATTIWERWDGIKPDGSFQDEGMNSFNHYAYGAIGEWLYSVVAGLEIDPEQPGYKHVIVQPHTGGGLTYAKAAHQSMYGTVAAGWELRDGVLYVGIDVPANTRATVRLPLAPIGGCPGKRSVFICGPGHCPRVAGWQDGGD